MNDESMMVSRARFRLVATSASCVFALTLGLSGCSSGQPGATMDETTNTSTAEGELAVYMIDREDGVMDVDYFLRLPDDTERKLVFDRDPGLSPGVKIRVWGDEFADFIHVASFQVDASGLGTANDQLIAARPFPARKMAFVLVNVNGEGVNRTRDQALDRIFNNPSTSLRHYYLENTYQTQDIAGDVFGPFDFAMNGCDTSGLTSALRSRIPGTFDHYLWYLGSRQSACGWGGLAQLGTPTRPARDTWYNATDGCVVIAQEPGHNFGMQHSSSIKCGAAILNDDPNNGSCVHSEYGDRFDPMGGGCRHMNAWQKTYNGWLSGCNVVTVGATGDFTLLPLEPSCNGIQVLQIAMPKTRLFSRSGGGGAATTDSLTHYYVELRTGVGFDAGLPPTVLVHVGGAFRSRTERGLHTWILDMNPSTTSVDGMTVGQTFTDPAGGISIRLDSADTTKAKIHVTIPGGTAAPKCIDGSAITAPGPQTCGG
jgi:hypothetical protein